MTTATATPTRRAELLCRRLASRRLLPNSTTRNRVISIEIAQTYSTYSLSDLVVSRLQIIPCSIHYDASYSSCNLWISMYRKYDEKSKSLVWHCLFFSIGIIIIIVCICLFQNAHFHRDGKARGSRVVCDNRFSYPGTYCPARASVFTARATNFFLLTSKYSTIIVGNLKKF